MRIPLAIAAILLCASTATARAEDCATYVDAFNAAPDAAGAEEQLYNAGVCYQQAHSIGSAIQMFEVLSSKWPKATVTGPAIYQLGRLYAQIAWYDQAAQKLEDYAKRYAADADVEAALQDAITYRIGLGADDQAIEDTQLYVKLFGGKRKEEAATAMFRLTLVYERQGDPDKVVAHLQRYLKQYANVSADRVVQAYAKIGEALWRQACDVKTYDGSCVKVTRARAAKGAYCATYEAGVEVVARDAKQVKEATTALKAAISTYEKSKSSDPTSLYFYAHAQFLLSEAAYEAYLAVTFPAGLDFDPAHAAATKKSLKKLSEWLAQKQKLGYEASKRYQKVLELRDAASAIAASARLGQIPREYARALYSAEIPKSSVNNADATAAYCDTLAEHAEPMLTVAYQAFEACLQLSTQTMWSDDWSSLCDRELGQMDPKNFPVSSELRGELQQPGLLTTLEGPLFELPPEDE